MSCKLKCHIYLFSFILKIKYHKFWYIQKFPFTEFQLSCLTQNVIFDTTVYRSNCNDINKSCKSVSQIHIYMLVGGSLSFWQVYMKWNFLLIPRCHFDFASHKITYVCTGGIISYHYMLDLKDQKLIWHYIQFIRNYVKYIIIQRTRQNAIDLCWSIA